MGLLTVLLVTPLEPVQQHNLMGTTCLSYLLMQFRCECLCCLGWSACSCAKAVWLKWMWSEWRVLARKSVTVLSTYKHI